MNEKIRLAKKTNKKNDKHIGLHCMSINVSVYIQSIVLS